MVVGVHSDSQYQAHVMIQLIVSMLNELGVSASSLSPDKDLLGFCKMIVGIQDAQCCFSHVVVVDTVPQAYDFWDAVKNLDKEGHFFFDMVFDFTGLPIKDASMLTELIDARGFNAEDIVSCIISASNGSSLVVI